MRHLGSLLAGILIAPVAWILIALGQQKSLATLASWQRSGTFDTADLLEPASILLAAGILIGLIATLRISPLGAMIAGLFYTGTYLGLFVSPIRVRNAVPETLGVLGRKIALRTPLDNGTLLLIGIALLVAAFSVGRWRRWPAAAAVSAPAAEPVEPGAPPSSPADLPPEPTDPDRTLAQWPPADPNPWTPVPPPRHSVDDERAAADTPTFVGRQPMDYPSAEYPAASLPRAPEPPPAQPTLPVQQPNPPPSQPSPPVQQPNPPPSQPSPPVQESSPPVQPSPPSSLPPDGFPPPSFPPPTFPPHTDQSGPASSTAREPATKEDAEQPPAAPPASPWSAPPPRSGQG